LTGYRRRRTLALRADREQRTLSQLTRPLLPMCCSLRAFALLEMPLRTLQHTEQFQNLSSAPEKLERPNTHELANTLANATERRQRK
jgi:hypothetical protein